MSNNMSNHPHKSPCLSSQEMLDYTQGILSTQEQHRFEKHLLDCEFCSDALEGIQMMDNPNSLLAIEEELNLEIDAITSEEEDIEVKVLFPWRMAAAIVLIFISTFTLWMVIPKNNTQELASEKLVPYPAPSENSSAPLQESHEMLVANEQLSTPSRNHTPPVLEREVHSKDAVAETPKEKATATATDEVFSSTSIAKEESDAAIPASNNELATAPPINATSDDVKAGASLPEETDAIKKSAARATTSAVRKQSADAGDDSDKFKTDDLYKRGIKEYKNKKYSASIFYLEQCSNKPEALFYSGVSYFLMENPHLALSTLEKYIQTNQSTYREASFWYIGLSCLQVNNKSAAKQSFENVLPFKGEFEKQAMEMLKSL
jgi:hypothetical protein